MAEVEIKEFQIPVLCKNVECERCNVKLRDAMRLVKGVQAAELDPANATLKLSFDPNLVDLSTVEKRAREAGCEIAERFGHDTWTLLGLDCPDCALKLEAAVGRLPGVVWVSANYATAKISVEYEVEKVEPTRIVSTIRAVGYGVAEAEAAPEEKVSMWREPSREITTAVSGAFLAAGLIASQLGASDQVANALYLLGVVSGGFYVLRSGGYSIMSRTLDMNFLVSVAAIGAIILGQWLEAAALIFIFALGGMLESVAMERNRRSLRALVALSPQEALIKHHDHADVTRVEDIQIGAVMIVKPGERLAMDGVVVAGGSSINEAPVTGESLPVDKIVGDRVYAGTINEHGALEVRVTKRARDNTLAKIIHLVEEAQSHKAPIQLFTERFGRIYSPAVVATAVFVGIVPPFVLGAPFQPWISKALILLVVACPCSLVISVPVAMVSAIGNAAHTGILVKGGAHLEAAGTLSVIAFDKTGTLTTGRPEVTDIIPVNGFGREHLLTVAAGLESRSEHPIAQAIGRAAARAELATAEVVGFQAVPGAGAKGDIDGLSYFVGNWRFFEDHLLPLTARHEVLALEEQGKTVVFVGTSEKLVGMLALADQIRPESARVIAKLRDFGLAKLVMLTGDNEATAKLISDQLGLDAYHAELMPEDKVEIISALRQKYGRVAMVGDGINDAPALATATLGVAMGAAGTDVALETADMALMADDIDKLPYAMDLSRRALRVVKQNVAFSMAVVALLIVGTFAGYLTLARGVIGHESSALLVILNGMRLLRRA